MNRLLLSLCLLLSACVPRAFPPPLPVVAPPAERLLERLAENAAAYRSLEGLAKVRVTNGGKTLSATQAILAEKPDRLRTEVLSPFGTPMASIASDGAQLAVLLPGEGILYQGEASAQNLRRFTGLPLQLDDLVQILLYEVPILPHVERTVAIAGDGWLLTLHGEEKSRQELRFDGQLRLVEAAYYLGSELQLRVRYDRFSAVDLDFPAGTDLEMPVWGAAATLNFSELRTNTAIPGERFRIEPTAGIEIRELP